MKRNEIIDLLGIIAVYSFFIVLMVGLHFLAKTSHAYTIVDTVYVAPTPASITVTMSWEEWEEYLECLDGFWVADPVSDSAWFQSDSLMDTVVFYDTP